MAARVPLVLVVGEIQQLQAGDYLSNNIGNLFFFSNGAVGKIPGYWTCPFAGTITGWNITVDAGTITIKVWKVGTGTAHPTNANSINTSGLSLSTGTSVHSTTVTDFTTVDVNVGDVFAVEITASSGVSDVGGSIEITKD